jgi:hypothetical protein
MLVTHVDISGLLRILFVSKILIASSLIAGNVPQMRIIIVNNVLLDIALLVDPASVQPVK